MSADMGISRQLFEVIRTHPQLKALRTVIQNNPAGVPEVMRLIGETNPQLMRLMTENQEEFLKLMNARSSFDFSTAEFDVDDLDAEDFDSINRLKELGFPEHLAIQAYVSCDKNEALAAEFLITQNNEYH